MSQGYDLWQVYVGIWTTPETWYSVLEHPCTQRFSWLWWAHSLQGWSTVTAMQLGGGRRSQICEDRLSSHPRHSRRWEKRFGFTSDIPFSSVQYFWEWFIWTTTWISMAIVQRVVYGQQEVLDHSWIQQKLQTSHRFFIGIARFSWECNRL